MKKNLTNLTVDQAYEAIKAIREAGHGASALVIAYESGKTTLGAQAAMPVVGFSVGFDWDSGKVFAQPEQPLGVAGPELEKLRRNSDIVAGKMYNLRRILGDASLTLQQRVEALGKVVES